MKTSLLLNILYRVKYIIVVSAESSEMFTFSSKDIVSGVDTTIKANKLVHSPVKSR